MRKYAMLCAVLTAVMILLPLTAMEKQHKTVFSSKAQNTSTTEDVISVMKSENGKVESLSATEYVVGALAAEMSMSCHDEALKAQAVACYTYALYIKEHSDKSELNGADISDASSKHQGYLDKAARKKKWGENFDEYEEKAQEIVSIVEGQKMTYNGEVILAAYHELCSGKTESAETVWGEDIPYLQSVTSAGDKLAPGLDTTETLSAEEFKSAVQVIDGIQLHGEPEEWVGKTETTESGFVKTIEIDGVKVSSNDIKKALSLRSRNFSISFSNDKFTVKTVGNGHMVGMSQYGADYMARQGAGWQEILKHYYSGIKINL